MPMPERMRSQLKAAYDEREIESLRKRIRLLEDTIKVLREENQMWRDGINRIADQLTQGPKPSPREEN